MKHTTKISLMSGLMFAGIALGGIHIANAQNNVNNEVDNSRYTVMIPSEVNIDKNTGKGSFAVTGKVKAQSTIDVSIQSKNGYKLKDKNGELPYNIDKKSFSIDNSRSASDIPLNEEFNIVSKTNTKVSGNYTDSLTFDITGEAYKYRLDVNGNLDENGIGDGRLDNFGRFDVYLNGKLVKENAEDFCESIPYGTTWEIKNIRSLDGYRYKESSDIRTKGVAGDVVEWEGDLLGDTSIYRITYVNLKFYSNKLTINYHADGATKLLDWSTKPESYKDISGVDIFHSTTNVYGTAYSNGAGGLTDVDRLSGKQGYKVLSGYWKINKTGEQKYSDNIGFKNTENCAEYLGVLNELKKNDTTIDLYPIWIPNTYTLTYILNGGSFNASTTQLFKYGSGDAISSETPNKAGYNFTGWRWNEVIMQPGDKIPKNWGDFTLTAQWSKPYKKDSILNIEGTKYIVLEEKEDDKALVMPVNSIGNRAFQSTSRSDNLNFNTYEGSEIDSYLENNWYNSLPSAMKMAIQATNIKQASYSDNYLNAKQDTGPNGQLYNTISRHVYLPSVDELSKAVDLTSSDKITSFLNGTSIWTRDSYQRSALPVMILDADDARLSNNDVYMSYGVRPCFTIDLSKVNYTMIGTGNYIYPVGTVLNVKGSQYIVINRQQNDNYLVIRKDSIGNRAFQSSARADGQNFNTYQGSEIDNYLENSWYNSLPSAMKTAIQPINIKQVSYSDDSLGAKLEVGYNSQVYNAINRHIYLPSVEEIGKVVNLNNSEKITSFLNGTSIWTRDSYQRSALPVMILDADDGCLSNNDVYMSYGVHPAFVIDLSKIDYALNGTVNYK